MNLPTLAECKKFAVALIGVIVMVLNAGLVDGATEHWLSVVVSLAVAAGVYTVKNVKKSDPKEPLE